jgi:deoxyribose-phosphate aldolase
MNIEEILSRCDHTLLKQDCTATEIRHLCDQAIANNCASVCIPPCHVAGARRYVGEKMRICTVIGFPNGYTTTAAKVYETADAVKNGADEIDMVVNLAMVKDACWNDVRQDIREVREACKDKILKVIIECCLLTEEEKIKLCIIVAECNADYIKTSTGFSTGGATVEDVKLLRKYSPPQVKVKAAGGVHTFEEAEALIEAGADRIGASHLVDAIKNCTETEINDTSDSITNEESENLEDSINEETENSNDFHESNDTEENAQQESTENTNVEVSEDKDLGKEKDSRT